MHRTLLRAAAVAATALALPAAANAATVSMDGGTLVYAADTPSEGLSLLLSSYTPYEEGVKYLSFSDSGADSRNIGAGAPCKIDDPGYDAKILCEFNPNRPIRIEGSNVTDSLSIYSATEVPDTIPVTLNGNGGNDQLKDAYDSQTGRTLNGGAGNDKIEGYAGDDALDGGDGDDEVDGGEGNDQVRGGGGNDTLLGDRYKTPGADLIDGGPGNDLVGEWSIPDQDFNPKPSISLDGVANDGRPGEGDNVVNIERVEQNIATDFTGSDGPETVEIRNGGSEAVTLVGNGGDDKLLAWDGNDTVNGGAGADHVEGGLGSDVVVGGPGPDTIYGEGTRSFCGGYSCKIPFGNDTIDAADGEKDTVDCGAGDDTAKVDAIDAVSGCERVETVGATPQQNGGPGPVASGPKITLAGKTTKRALLGGKLSVKVPCAASCRINVTLKKGGKTLATGKATRLSGGTSAVKLKVAKSARRMLKRRGKVKASLVIKITGADKKTQTVTRAVTLK